MKTPSLNFMLAATLLLSVISVSVATASESRQFVAIMGGFQEPPSVYTTGAGTFEAKLNRDGTALDYTMSYQVEGEATQAHLHFARSRVNGGVIVFLCQTADFPDPAGTAPQCPTSGGTVSGTINSDNVIGPTDQGIQPGDFQALVRSMRAAAVYVNLHSTLFPAGELRGQVVDKNFDF